MEIEKFLTYLKNRKHYSPLTIKSYYSDLTQFEDFLVGDDTDKSVLGDDALIGVNAVRSWVMTLTEQRLTARSINRKISSLRAYFKWREQMDTDFKNPMLKIISPKISKRKIGAISNDDMQVLLKSNSLLVQDNDSSDKKVTETDDFEQCRNSLIVEMLYATGVRQAELLGIKETDIYFNNRELRIIGKGNKERVIPINSKLIDHIVKYIDIKRRYNIKESYLMVTEKGKRLSKYQLYNIVHKLLENVNVGEKSPHIFRHTCATHLVNEGADIINVKNLLGHSSLKATEVYTHTTIEQLKKEYKRWQSNME